jgi:hypothetical protein
MPVTDDRRAEERRNVPGLRKLVDQLTNPELESDEVPER